MSTALLTDRYELTMVEAALRSGYAGCPAVFEVFTRRLPERRPWGVFAGLGRLLEALEEFRFGPDELAWLASAGVVGPATLEWLEAYRFGGSVDAYREGELFTAGSPVLTVEATFAEAVLLETLVLSTLNFDSAVASAASLITCAAGERPVIEMGSRRVDPAAAVAAARAAYIGGFASTSNLEAGRRYGIPTAGTASHAFVLAYPSETEAFCAQVEAFGENTTLLVDTYDTQTGIRHAVEAAGPRLGSVRIDSGDLGTEAVRARALLDELGAHRTRLVVTGDLDAHTIAALGAAPVDAYGVGANVVTGMGVPTAGFVYKLVAVGAPPAPGVEGGTVGGAQGPPARRETVSVAQARAARGPLRPVAKRSAGKASHGGRKWAWRAYLEGAPTHPEPGVPPADGPAWADIVSTTPDITLEHAQALQVRVMEAGTVVHRPCLEDMRSYHLQARERVGPEPLLLERLVGTASAATDQQGSARSQFAGAPSGDSLTK